MVTFGEMGGLERASRLSVISLFECSIVFSTVEVKVDEV